MLRGRLIRVAAIGAALSLSAVACGQKPGVHVEGRGGTAVVAQPGTVDDQGTSTGGSDSGAVPGGEGGTTTDGSGTADVPGGDATGGDASSGGGDADAGSGSGSSGGGTGTGTGSGSSGSGGSSGGSTGGGSATPQGSDRTGASAEKIVVGIHAPVTGAAPLPSTSFEKGGPLYWEHVIQANGQDVLGRKKVEVIFRDDKYDPTSARQVCREMAAEAFLGVGGGGTDQIQACGQYAQVAKWPYFSAGVTEEGLRGNPWYFAASMSYAQQTALVAQWVKKKYPGKKVGGIITDTPNFDDAKKAWEANVAKYGLNYYKTLSHPKGDTSWYSSYVNDMQSNGVEVLFFLSSPVDYIRFAQKGSENSYKPQYVGVGISKGLNAVLNSGCDDVDGGEFLSPFPGLDYARKNIPEFFEAGKQFGRPTDDISLALWGINKSLHQAFQAYGNTFGNDLTREDFRGLVETLTIKTGVFPEVRFRPDDHFGGQGAHMLKANCATGEHETLASFASSF